MSALMISRIGESSTATTLATIVAILFAVTAAFAQDRYIRAEEDPEHNLVITTHGGSRVVVPKSVGKQPDSVQVGFGKIAIAPDGSAVGWLSYRDNCCTSYSIPAMLETFSGGKRMSFDPAIVAWDWCFVDGGTKVAARSTTVHGPQHAILELWDIKSGARLEEFYWMEGEQHPRAPSWVVALRAESSLDSEKQTHVCR
jgi:hypothetical protein